MNKIKLILGYVLGFASSVCIAAFVLLFSLKTTLYSESYVKRTLERQNYYKNVSDEIKDSMEAYMISTGLPDTVLDSIYTDEEVKNDINLFIEGIYKGEKVTIDSDKVKEKLTDNINKYLSEHDVKIVSQKSIDSFIKEMTKIYTNNIKLYGHVDKLVGKFYKAGKWLNIGVAVSGIVSVILIVILVVLKTDFIGAVMGASGLIILFTRFVIYEKIDTENILVLSEYFSEALKTGLSDFAGKIVVLAFVLAIIGTILTFCEAFRKREK